MKKALLIIGDGRINQRKPAPSFKSFVKHIKRLEKKFLEVHIIDYSDVLEGNLPEIPCPILNIMLFFPYKYWTKNIEVYKKGSRVYGDKMFGWEYKKFFEEVGTIIRKKYRDKRIKYINPPKSSILERDKKESKELFQKNNIPTPKIFSVKSPEDIQQLIARGKALYIKPRFGAFGKGITYFSKDLMVTNFLIKKGRIISRPYDYNWKFAKVKDRDRKRFLNGLLSSGCICEEAVDPTVFKGKRFDFRIYCIYGKIPYYYVRSMPEASPVTNWSQGGKIEKEKNFARYIPRAKIKQVKSLARRVARELNLNYTGVDIIVSKRSGKAYVLEAHSFPGYEKGFDLMGYLAGKICT